MNVVRHYVHTIRPHYDAAIAAVAAHARFLMKLTLENVRNLREGVMQ